MSRLVLVQCEDTFEARHHDYDPADQHRAASKRLSCYRAMSLQTERPRSHQTVHHIESLCAHGPPLSRTMARFRFVLFDSTASKMGLSTSSKCGLECAVRVRRYLPPNNRWPSLLLRQVVIAARDKQSNILVPL